MVIMATMLRQRTMAKSEAEEQEVVFIKIMVTQLLAPLVAEAHGVRAMAHQGGRREMPTARIEVPGEELETGMDEAETDTLLHQQEDNADQDRP
jgi:hypothetical protein